MNAQSKVFIQPFEVIDQLSALGLTTEILTEVIKRGYADRANATATENDPPNAAGSMEWFGTVRSLREFLFPLGWEKRIIHNSPLTSNRETSISIVVYSGNQNVGTEVIPKTKNPKGKQLESYIRENNNDFDIFEMFGNFKDKSVKPAKCQTWVLLYYPDIEKSEIRSEFSLPSSIDNRGYINDWKERIVLDPIPLDNSPIAQNKLIDINNLPDIDIPIERKK